jgi:integrase
MERELVYQSSPTWSLFRKEIMVKRNQLFWVYYDNWIKVYKDGAIRKATMDKYRLSAAWVKRLVPTLKTKKLDRTAYQELLNAYAEYHERETTMGFHHQLKAAILDAVDDGQIENDPTRKAIIKGKEPRAKKQKFLNQYELHTLLMSLDLKSGINTDWLILLIAKTGMRFAEALAVTPKDFDFSHQTLSINKSYDYKSQDGFMPTKNKSSVRKIQIDWQIVTQFSEALKDLPEDKPIFVDGKVYNSTVNGILARHCRDLSIPVITVHGLRHTHASLLLYAGVSIASVARRLGHASMTTTQKIYLHIIQELENKDIDLVMRSLSSLS